MKRQHAAELKQLETDNENRIQQITTGYQQEIEQLKVSCYISLNQYWDFL